MDQEKLNEILKKHALWLQDKPGGARANLRGVHLYKAYLYKADVQGS